MSTDLASDLREIVLSNSSFGPAEIAQLSQGISDDYANFTTLRDAIGELESRVDHTPATAVRLGVCYYLLCRMDDGRDVMFGRVEDLADMHHLLGSLPLHIIEKGS